MQKHSIPFSLVNSERLMDPILNIKISQFFKKLTTFQQRMIIFVTFLTLAAILSAAFSRDSSSVSNDHNKPGLNSTFHPIIKKACTNTLYSSLCFSTLSSIPPSKNLTTFHQILEFAINRTQEHVGSTRVDILAHFMNQDLNPRQKNALDDCLEMLDQTLYELGQATDDLRAFPASIGYLHRSYGNLKTLLSAAMTNENTCIDGFSDLEESNPESENHHKSQLLDFLTPISRMISNCLAITKYIENLSSKSTLNNHRYLITKRKDDEFLDSVASVKRRMMKIEPQMRPNVSVASDGSGNYTMISEAIAVAPNMSTNRYVIKIQAGIYNESVVVPREKINIVLLGAGMNSTIITGSKSFADGFSTFESATLTVIGDKFLARDLTIVNTAGPEKHQAVALRVTSNAAFYRCEIISYQDTLYAHSLRQYYRDCSIQGTIDFIFGNAAAIFQNCLILVRKPNPGQSNMITAQGRGDPNQNTGISLQNCTIKAAPGFNLTERHNVSTFLGRPWRNYSRTIIMQSYMDDLIHPEGWCKWNEYSTLDTVDYIEYMNTGPGSDTRRRINWAGYKNNCSENIARQFTVRSFLHGADDWLQSSVFPLFRGPF